MNQPKQRKSKHQKNPPETARIISSFLSFPPFFLLAFPNPHFRAGFLVGFSSRKAVETRKRTSLKSDSRKVSLFERFWPKIRRVLRNSHQHQIGRIALTNSIFVALLSDNRQREGRSVV